MPLNGRAHHDEVVVMMVVVAVIDDHDCVEEYIHYP